jgi:hypothetical protein
MSHVLYTSSLHFPFPMAADYLQCCSHSCQMPQGYPGGTGLVSKDSNLCPFSGSLTPERIIRQQFSTVYTTHQSLRWNYMVPHKSYMAEKHDMHHFQSAWTLSWNSIPCQCQGILFSTLTLQFWIRRVHPQLSYCQNVTRKILLLAPSIRENMQMPTVQVWHTKFHSACVESTLHRPSGCSVGKHTSYRYSHFCCNSYAHQDAVFFEHSTNMLHISYLLWLSAYHCKEHILHPSTHHKWHSPHHPPKGDSFIEWGTSHQPFIQGLITLPWHFHKQEMKKLSQWAQLYTRNFLAAILSPLFS